MKTEQQVRDEIKKVTKRYHHVLVCAPATLNVNAPRALMQVEAITSLIYLYWILGEKRPKFKYDT